MSIATHLWTSLSSFVVVLTWRLNGSYLSGSFPHVVRALPWLAARAVILRGSGADGAKEYRNEEGGEGKEGAEGVRGRRAMPEGARSLRGRTAILAWVIVGKTERRRPVKGSCSEPDAGEDRVGGVDEGREDAEGPWGRRTKT